MDSAPTPLTGATGPGRAQHMLSLHTGYTNEKFVEQRCPYMQSPTLCDQPIMMLQIRTHPASRMYLPGSYPLVCAETRPLSTSQLLGQQPESSCNPTVASHQSGLVLFLQVMKRGQIQASGLDLLSLARSAVLISLTKVSYEGSAWDCAFESATAGLRS